MKHITFKSNSEPRQTPLFIGADVSKSKVDFAYNLDQKHIHFTLANDSQGIKDMLLHLKKLSAPCHIILEPTGVYSRLLVDSLEKAQVPSTSVNPRHARDFARAQGKLSKTDKVDAFSLARYGTLFQPKADIPLSQNQKKLREFQSAQTTLIEQRANLLNAIKAYAIKQIVCSFEKSILALTKQIDLLDKLIHELIEQDAPMNKKYKTLISIQGVGSKTAVAFLAMLPELGSLNRKQIAALAGLAPREWESGQMKGRCCIQGGRVLLRKFIYMAAMVASNHNDVLSVIYREMVTRGKKKKVAIIAIARRLVCYSNYLIANILKDGLMAS